MSETTNIEWCDATFNPWIGCTKVSPGCDHCYAERSMPARTMQVNWGAGATRYLTSAGNWRLPIKWNRQADEFQAKHGRRRKVFCASLADVFDNAVPAQWRFDLMKLIELTPNLDWLILTKRIGNAAAMLEQAVRAINHGKWGWADNVFPNIWLGATIVDQDEADRDIRKLLQVPAAKRFLSIEPLLGPIDLTHTDEGEDDGSDFGGWPNCDAYSMWANVLTGEVFSAERHGQNLRGVERSFVTSRIDWVIVGGESGPHARLMHPNWARSLRDSCAAAGVPFLFKQWGEWAPDWEGAMTCKGCGATKFTAAVNTRHRNSDGNDECGHCGGSQWDDAIAPLDSMCRVGKKAAGRLLDGRTWDQFPQTASTNAR